MYYLAFSRRVRWRTILPRDLVRQKTDGGQAHPASYQPLLMRNGIGASLLKLRAMMRWFVTIQNVADFVPSAGWNVSRARRASWVTSSRRVLALIPLPYPILRSRAGIT